MTSRFAVLFAGISVAMGALPSHGARSIRAIYFQRPAAAPDKVHLYHEKGVIEMPLPGMNLSSRQDLPAGDLLFRCLVRPLAEGELIPEAAPVVRVSKGWTDVILLFAVNPKSKDFPFHVTALDASPSKFRPGELLCFNRTNTTLGGVVGLRKVRIAPGKSQIIKPPARGQSDYRVMFDYLLPGGERALPLTRTTWRHEPAVRHLLFIVPDPVRKVPRIWSVPDRIPPPPPDGKPD